MPCYFHIEQIYHLLNFIQFKFEHKYFMYKFEKPRLQIGSSRALVRGIGWDRKHYAELESLGMATLLKILIVANETAF